MWIFREMGWTAKVERVNWYGCYSATEHTEQIIHTHRKEREGERERESSLNSLSLNHLNQTAYSVLRTLFLSISPTDYDSGSLALSVHISVSPSLSLSWAVSVETITFGSDSLAALSSTFNVPSVSLSMRAVCEMNFSHSLHYFWNDDYHRHWIAGCRLFFCCSFFSSPRCFCSY